MLQPFPIGMINPAAGGGLPSIDQTNLIRWWDADFDATSSTWTDQTGTQDASVGGVSYVSGTPSVYDFPGGSGVIGIGHAAATDINCDDIGVQMWIKLDNTNNTNYCIASQRSGVNSSTCRFSFHINAGNNTVGIYNGFAFSPLSVSGLITLTNNVWYFVEVMCPNNGTTEFYINDISVASTSTNNNTGAGAEPWGIGTPNYGLSTYSGEYFQGDIAMCLVYDTNTRPSGNWDATKARFGY